MASGSFDYTIIIWRVSSGEHVKTFTGHSFFVSSVTFSPNGEYLASGSFDDTIGLWKVSNGEKLKTLKGHSS